MVDEVKKPEPTMTELVIENTALKDKIKAYEASTATVATEKAGYLKTIESDKAEIIRLQAELYKHMGTTEHTDPVKTISAEDAYTRYIEDANKKVKIKENGTYE